MGSTRSAFIGSLDIFLFPTNYANEAEPLVIYEAMRRGVYVIACDRGAISEMLLNGAWPCRCTGRYRGVGRNAYCEEFSRDRHAHWLFPGHVAAASSANTDFRKKCSLTACWPPYKRGFPRKTARILFEPSRNMPVKNLIGRIAFTVVVSACASLCSTAGLADRDFRYQGPPGRGRDAGR